jgi:hypothetical protein
VAKFRTRRASQGEIDFSSNVEPEIREVLAEMWRNRLRHFCNIDIVGYLRDDTKSTRYVAGPIRLSGSIYRSAARAVFLLRALFAPLGIRVEVELLDASAVRNGTDIATCGTLVVAIRGTIIRQGHVEMSAVRETGRWTWKMASESRIPRREWQYAACLDADGRVRFDRRKDR